MSPMPYGTQAWCQSTSVTFAYSSSNGFSYLKGQLACATAFGIAAGGFLDLKKQ